MTQVSDLPIPSHGPYQQTAAFAGPPPLIAGERPAGYDELLARVCETLQPSDVLEHIWVRDIVDLVWEVYRLRRLKADLMSAAAHEGMAQLLKPLLRSVEPVGLARAWAARRENRVSMVEATLAAAGLTMDHVAAATLAIRISDFERIERMTASAEGRRNSALHELDLHRASFALRLRRAARAGPRGRGRRVRGRSRGGGRRRGGGMTSARKIAANRRNALASTGPRTAAGKARVAQNARRHGLTLPGVLRSGVVGGDQGARALDRGRGCRCANASSSRARIAAAQIDLVRARRARQDIFPKSRPEPDAIRRLAAMDRYERRARSRRKLAIRDFDDAGGSMVRGERRHFGRTKPTEEIGRTKPTREIGRSKPSGGILAEQTQRRKLAEQSQRRELAERRARAGGRQELTRSPSTRVNGTVAGQVAVRKATMTVAPSGSSRCTASGTHRSNVGPLSVALRGATGPSSASHRP